LRIAQRGGDTKKNSRDPGDMFEDLAERRRVQNDEAYTRLLLLDSNSRNDEARMTNDEKENANIQRRTPNADFCRKNSQLSTLNSQRTPAARCQFGREKSAQHAPSTLLALVILKQNRAADATRRLRQH